MKSITNFCLLALAVMIYSSCATPLNVSTDYDKSADFTKYKTFAFYQLVDKSESISDLNKNRIINSVKDEMVRKGFTENTTNPDMLVHVTTILQSMQSVTANTNYYGYGGYYRPYGWGPGYSGTTTYNTYNYKDGSLIIDIVDAPSKQLVWQGTGNKEIDKPSKDPDTAIKEAVTKIMEAFPPGAATKK